MPNGYLDDPDLEEDELEDLLGGGEASESYLGVPEDAEARRTDAFRTRRRLLDRQARVAMARQRSQVARPAQGRAPVGRAISTLDVRSKVQADATSKALVAQSRRITGTQYAVIGTTAQRQLEASSFQFANPILAAAARATPLLPMRAAQRRSGLAVLSEPQFLGFGVVVGIAVLATLLARTDEVFEVRFTTNDRVFPAKSQFRLQAVAVDSRGRVVPAAITFESSDPKIATIDPTTGDITSSSIGNVILKAKEAGGKEGVGAFEFK
jgi:hypothetical protein